MQYNSQFLQVGLYQLGRERVKEKVYSIRPYMDGARPVYIPEDEQILNSQYSSTVLDHTQFKDVISLINAYREIAKSSDVDEAIREIVNECFSGDGADEAFKPKFKPDCPLSVDTQKKIEEAFKHVYHNLLDFDRNGYTYFRQWYIDGRLAAHIATDESRKTIKHIQFIDPLQIRRIKEERYNKDTGLIDLSRTKFVYYYIPASKISNNSVKSLWGTFNNQYHQTHFLKFFDDGIAWADSGLIDPETNEVLSHLYKVIKPYNDMKMMEEAMMIYRIVRAPERRAFYIDVGGMGAPTAKQYINDIKNTFNNKTSFDPSTNSYVNKRAVHSMVEDYFLPRRNGAKGTEIQSIGGAENLGVTKDIEYLKDKFYRALNVPIGRLNAEMQNTNLLLGRTSEMQRDEYRFKRFIDNLRKNFIPFVEKILMTELVLRKVTTQEDWEEKVLKYLYWEYVEDNSFIEIKKAEKIRSKLELLQSIDNYVGVYFSKEWVRKEILGMSDKDIDEMKAQMEEDAEDEKSGEEVMPNGSQTANDVDDGIEDAEVNHQPTNSDTTYKGYEYGVGGNLIKR